VCGICLRGAAFDVGAAKGRRFRQGRSPSRGNFRLGAGGELLKFTTNECDREQSSPSREENKVRRPAGIALRSEWLWERRPDQFSRVRRRLEPETGIKFRRGFMREFLVLQTRLRHGW